MGYIFKDRRRGREVWAVAYEDVDGRVRKERTKAANRTLARRILADRQDAVENAKLQKLRSVQELLAPKPSPTIRIFSEEYMLHVQALCSPSTVKRYSAFLKKDILPKLGHLTLKEANAGHIQKYGDERLKTVAPATARQELMFLSGMFREAIKRDMLDRNPVARVDKPSIDNQIVRYLDPDEERRLLGFSPEPLRTAILISIHSGLRDGELRNLTWADVRLRNRFIVVRNTKSKRDRVVPMSKTLYGVLEKLPRHIKSPYVITNTDTATKYDHFNNTSWRKALTDAGIKNFRWHDLRHTFGSRLAQAGVPILAIKELMGHSQITVTMRYAHLAPSNLTAAVTVLDQDPQMSTGEPSREKKGQLHQIVPDATMKTAK